MKFIKYLKLSVVLAWSLLFFLCVACDVKRNESLSEQVFSKKPDGFVDYYHQITVPIGEKESGYSPGYRTAELQKLMGRQVKKSFSDTLVWNMRGPYNVGGRSRTVIVDPDDPTNNTWYAGSAGGGVWKTTDGGKSWMDLTPDFPNLATVSLCMAESDHDVIYVGTGEGFGGVGMITGNGVFVTMDRGQTWSQLESTMNRDFYYINKIWVDPDDSESLLVATNRGLHRSVDGGVSWGNVYPKDFVVQDIVQNPGNSNVLYASVNSYGIIKSTNRGVNWVPLNSGLGGIKRISLAVSPVDTSIVFASVETPEKDMAVYISENGGGNWRKHGPDDEFFNFHGAQGWYNNTITADPYIAKKAFVGGVYIGTVTFEDSIYESSAQIRRVDTVGTGSFLDFINFGGSHLGGGMSTGLEEKADVLSSDFTSVEIRFGNGKSQKAHRFLVPEGEGPGVSPKDYIYADYVEVPFEVWDVEKNKQLMVSFRDQEREGAFNLILRDPNDEISGREYIFVHALEYDSLEAHSTIAVAGGHYSKMLYFFWPSLALYGEWNSDSVPEGMIAIDYGKYQLQQIKTEIISDEIINRNLHVDHHQLLIIPGSSPTSKYKIISANDGGIALSNNSGKFWEQLSYGFHTTQFYGVSKKPGEDVFIGGMQDNGTYMSPKGSVANESSYYEYMTGGDGFETIWHPADPDKIITSTYNNIFFSSNNGGETWTRSDYGLDENGPFISKLSYHPDKPNRLYAVDYKGVYIHDQFAKPNTYWKRTDIPDLFTLQDVSASSLSVEVSKADPNIVWAGLGMFKDPGLRMFVSTNSGELFDSTGLYEGATLGYISGLDSHPTEPHTAYVLFSYYNSPKILRTRDMGQTWEDISGFEGGTESVNGFPDVTVHCLLVMPHDPNVIWVGTEIGIVESIDNGETWNLLESDFPNVSVYQMHYQDGQIIIATHGRGIWTAGNFQVGVRDAANVDFTMKIFPNPATDYLFVQFDNGMEEVRKIRLVDMTGRQVADKEIDPLSSGRVVQLDIADASPGNYILEIWKGNRVHGEQVVVY